MTRVHRRFRAPSAQSGFGLVEIMVGVVIGLIAVLVIYQVYNVAEGFKRNTTAVGEAQQAGLFSAFMLGMQLGNAGTGLNTSATDLQWCANTGNIATTFRPIPVLITDGGGNALSDSFVVNYSVASTLMTTAIFAAPATGSVPYPVKSPGGFHVGDLIVAIATPNTPNSPCPSSTITGPPAGPDPNGIVTLTQSGTSAVSFTGSSLLFNMGPCSGAQKVQYNVVLNNPLQPVSGTNNGVLYSTPLLNTDPTNLTTCGQPVNPALNVLPCPAANCNPLASNIIVMKAEYGINTTCNTERTLDTWVQATPPWDATTLLAAPIACNSTPGTSSINQIKAVRIGIIVQSEQFDPSLAGFSGGDYTNGDYNWVLFDCPAHNATCQGRLTGTVSAITAPSVAGNWRFRKYETVIPLRNAVWNPT